MVVMVEVDCFRRLDAGISLPDDDLIAKGMIPAQIHASRMAHLAEARSASGLTTSFPNDHLASIQPFEDYGCDSEADMYVRRLSTITERTEKTEYTEVPARSSRSVSYSGRRNTRAPSSTSDSSYGQVIGKPHLNASFCSLCLCCSHCIVETQFDRMNLPLDPNTIRPSPPPSALQPSYDGSAAYDSGDDGSTRTVTPPPRRPSDPVQAPETSPDFADNHATSSRASSSKLPPVIPVQVFKTPHQKRLLTPVDKPLPDLPPPSEPRRSLVESHAPSDHPRKSNLSDIARSRVASSKASSISRSSRLSSSTLATSSVRTYPALRPSSQSELSFAEGEGSISANSSMVRHAIRTAMDQEAADRSAISPRKRDQEVQHDSTATSSSSSKSTAKPISEMRDGSPNMFYTAVESPVLSSSERPASKLKKIAEAKSKRGSGLPKLNTVSSPSPSTLVGTSHTEYITPIANGPTATTAITTSYQTLGNLLSPAQSALPPSFPPTGHNLLSPSSPEPRQSKLVMKARKPHLKPGSSTEEDIAHIPVPVHTMFKPEGKRSRASPSTFASILLDGFPLTSDEDKGHRKERREKLPRERRRGHDRTTTSSLDGSTVNAKPSSHKHNSSAVKAANMPLAPLGPFAFDVPSPDDAVFNARRGTSLARPASGASTLSAFPASTAHSRSSFTSGSRVSTSAAN
jgi:hypothetical protein